VTFTSIPSAFVKYARRDRIDILNMSRESITFAMVRQQRKSELISQTKGGLPLLPLAVYALSREFQRSVERRKSHANLHANCYNLIIGSKLWVKSSLSQFERDLLRCENLPLRTVVIVVPRPLKLVDLIVVQREYRKHAKAHDTCCLSKVYLTCYPVKKFTHVILVYTNVKSGQRFSFFQYFMSKITYDKREIYLFIYFLEL